MALVMSPEILDAAIGDQRDARPAARSRAFGDGGNLRDAGARDHARGADRARADADLHAIDAERDQIAGAFVGGDVAGDELHFRQALLDLFDGFHHAGGVAVGGIDHEHVHLGFGPAPGTLQVIAGRADGGADAQAAVLVFGGVGIFELFLNVLDGDQALEIEIVVHDEQFFDAMLVQDLLGFFERRADGDGDQIVLRHHVADGQIETASRSADRDW